MFTKKKAPGPPMDADAATLLGLAKAEADPVRRFQLLNRAEELAPKDIMVHRALLMHGRLHERDGRNPDYREEDGQRVMKQSEITVRVLLGRGPASDTVWTCDLSHDYVTINADYRS